MSMTVDIRIQCAVQRQDQFTLTLCGQLRLTVTVTEMVKAALLKQRGRHLN